MTAARRPTPDLVCPLDRTALVMVDSGYLCETCGRTYPVRDGVVGFLEERDDFYEGAFNNEVRFLPKGDGILQTLPLWLITNGYLWQVRKRLRPGARVLEVGCAGGVAWFGQQFRVTGVDVSHEGLAIAARKYELCLQAKDLRAVADSSMDAVISSYFWEHVTRDAKGAILDEVMRVLVPGGHLIFLYDVATSNPLISWMRKTRPDLYQSMFIDADGHLGYETADENDALFVSHGFRIVESNPMERTPLQSTSVYIKLRGWPGVAHWIGRALSILDRSPLLHMYNGVLRLIDDTVGRLFPRSWGRIMITVAQKP